MGGLSIFELISIVINLPLLFFAVGINVYIGFISKRELPKEAIEFMRLKADISNKSYVRSFPLEVKIINLPSELGRLHYLEVQMELNPIKNKYSKMLKKNEIIIYDILNDVISRMSASELNTVSGKFLLEERLKKRINELFAAPLVENIFFNRFIVQ